MTFDVVNRATRMARDASAKASVQAGNVTTTVLKSLGSAQSTIAAFQSAYPGGTAPMSESLFNTFNISQTGLAGKFMSVADLQAFNSDQSAQLQSLGNQVGQIREMTYSATKSNFLGKAHTTKNSITASFMDKIRA